LLADDVAAAISGLLLVNDATTSSAANSRLVADDAADLLRFWMSEPAQRFRARSGQTRAQ
jgi:hypothetical protein